MEVLWMCRYVLWRCYGRVGICYGGVMDVLWIK